MTRTTTNADTQSALAGTAAALTGIGTLILALAPLSIPFLALTAVFLAPLALPLLLLVPVALVVLAVRGVRRLATRGRDEAAPTGSGQPSRGRGLARAPSRAG